MRTLLLLSFLLSLASCGDSKRSQGGGNVQPPTVGRGHFIENFELRAKFSGTPQIEYLDFGGAILTTLTVDLVLEKGEREVIDEMFWESGRNLDILRPSPHGCVPSLFGIDPKRGTLQLKLWAWDNVGHSTACEEMIQKIPVEGFEMRLKDLRWAEVGMIQNFYTLISR